ncbi:hypothetical protein PWT90_08480 [Aphanocladium album]|nr:hypothetical protein PWT90_08480 [Aphanocladium album]
MAFSLPMHNLHMDKPAPSEVFDELKLRGSNFLQDRTECTGCGKHSGMDDFAHNALFAGIHSVEFMKDFLLGKSEQATPYTEHEVTCSRCNTKYGEPKSWLAYPPWTRY